MCRTIATGGAAINVFVARVGAEVVLVDVGVAASVSDLGNMLHRKVRLGTRDFSKGPAMTPEEAAEAIRIGSELVRTHAGTNDVFGLGEIGIGNTTSAAALTAALTTTPIARVVGSGTGVGPAGVQRKREIVAVALERLPSQPDPFHALAEVGGLEIAALVGVVLEAAIAGRAVVVDGFIAAAAALVAVRLAPPTSDYLFASHRSTEPGHSVLLESLGLRPLLELELRLGEGTGAALVFPILDVAAGILRDMATFGSAGVSQSGGSEQCI
jgi:nicotinate-nucleotide--dimethylbenzimidazole phosphoribosyltransferase